MTAPTDAARESRTPSGVNLAFPEGAPEHPANFPAALTAASLSSKGEAVHGAQPGLFEAMG